MTSTRTDTTPRQGIQYISLNNTRSHLRSPHAARSHPAPGTCSVPLNNEQGSIDKCADHTRELIHWVMSKHAVASCFIKDVLSMSESESAGRAHRLAFLFSTHPNFPYHRASLLLPWSCTLQISLPSRHRSRSYSVRTSCSLHAQVVLPPPVTTPELIFLTQWMMEPAPLNAHFALTKISQRVKRVKTGTPFKS
jgi:hypothetical protein